MSKTQVHQTQHRSRADKQRAREISDLQRINHQLQRQVLRLRKQLERSTEFQEDLSDPIMVLPEIPDIEMCSTCTVPMKELKLWNNLWMVCPSCQHRRKI